MAGWIKIHRDIQNHWIFQDAEKFKWWVDMILMASHENHRTLINGNLVSLKRGQFSASISFLASRWGRSKEKVLNFLKLLESDHMILRNSDRKSTTITICNYESYQDVSDQSPTTEPTDVRPMSDQSPTEYKNGKNGEEIYSSNQRAREGDVSWDVERERGYVETFRGQGSYMPLARKVGKTAKEVMDLLEVYMATRELKNRGHSDYSQFLNLFVWHVENDKIRIPAKPQDQPQQKKVISSKETRELMKEMGWQDS